MEEPMCRQFRWLRPKESSQTLSWPGDQPFQVHRCSYHAGRPTVTGSRSMRALA
jgi:hypothetical protein